MKEKYCRVSQLYIRVIDSINASVDRIILRRTYLPEPYGVLFTLAEIASRRVHFRKITFYERSDKFSYSPDERWERDLADTISSYCRGNSPLTEGRGQVEERERGVILYHKGETIRRRGPLREGDTASSHATSRRTSTPLISSAA